MCQHIWTCRHVVICADMCWHVPTCDINLDTSDSDHLDFIYMPACVSICGHADMCWYVSACAGMCQHVQSLSAPLIPTIWNLSWMLACVSTFGHADMFWCVLTCASMWHQPRHLLQRSFRPYLDAAMCQYLWTWHVLICADICRHVPACANMWNHSQHLWYQPFETCLAYWHVSAHLDMPTCTDMYQHVLTCANMCRHVTLISTPLIAVI